MRQRNPAAASRERARSERRLVKSGSVSSGGHFRPRSPRSSGHRLRARVASDGRDGSRRRSPTRYCGTAIGHLRRELRRGAHPSETGAGRKVQRAPTIRANKVGFDRDQRIARGTTRNNPPADRSAACVPGRGQCLPQAGEAPPRTPDSAPGKRGIHVATPTPEDRTPAQVCLLRHRRRECEGAFVSASTFGRRQPERAAPRRVARGGEQPPRPIVLRAANAQAPRAAGSRMKPARRARIDAATVEKGAGGARAQRTARRRGVWLDPTPSGSGARPPCGKPQARDEPLPSARRPRRRQSKPWRARARSPILRGGPKFGLAEGSPREERGGAVARRSQAVAGQRTRRCRVGDDCCPRSTPSYGTNTLRIRMHTLWDAPTGKCRSLLPRAGSSSAGRSLGAGFPGALRRSVSRDPCGPRTERHIGYRSPRLPAGRAPDAAGRPTRPCSRIGP